MANMSYCRFQNTSMDMRDCLDSLSEGKRLSDEEYKAYERLVELAKELVEDFGDYKNPPDPDDVEEEKSDATQAPPPTPEVSAFKQLCVWPGIFLGEMSPEKFEAAMAERFGVRVKFAEEVKTLPDVKNGRVVEGTGGRTDMFFYVHVEDIPRFAVRRLAEGIRWWEDVLGNEHGNIYPQAILDKYPRGW